MLIVTYHAIDLARSRVTVSRERLSADVSALSDAGYTFVTLDAVVTALRTGSLPARAVALTFDDGYRSVVTEALPLLSARGVPATVYVITDRIGQDNRWPGQPPSIPRLPLADAGELQELLAAGVTLGAHSASHRALPSLDASAVRKEIVVAADDLEQRVQRPVRHFAYPYGLFGERERAMAAARFDTAVTAECRGVDDASSPHALPRIDADDVRGAARLGLLGRAGLAQYLSVRRVLRRALR